MSPQGFDIDMAQSSGSKHSSRAYTNVRVTSPKVARSNQPTFSSYKLS